MNKEKGTQIKTLDRLIELNEEKKTVFRCAGELCKRTPACMVMKWQLGRANTEIERGMLFEYVKK